MVDPTTCWPVFSAKALLAGAPKVVAPPKPVVLG